MRRLTHYIILLLTVAAFSACKTTEANYRAAYDKAVAGRDSAMQFDQTIYGNQRRAIDARLVTTDEGDSSEIRTLRVAVLPEGGGLAEWLRAYNVVVGQFKQKINAVSMRERLSDAGYPRAMVLETPEPYYYVVVESYSGVPEAIKAVQKIKDDSKFPISFREPLPYIVKAIGAR